MERMNIENINNILKNEHEDRYRFISDSLHGNVLDLACGIGYGAEILTKNLKIQSYLGVDISSEAIEYANNTYKNNISSFINDSALTIDLEEKFFDFIISFETLEHIDEYQKVLKNFSKWLKHDGVLIGSIPETNWEDVCDDTYGKNHYHVVRFDIDKIKVDLESYFCNIVLFTNELAIGSLFRKLDITEIDKISLEYSSFINKVNGSLFFIASNRKVNFNKNIFYPSMCLVEYDNLKVLPQSILVSERDEYIKKLENLLEEYRKTSVIQTNMIDERDKTIVSQTNMIDERDLYIKNLEKIVYEYRNK